MQLIDKKQLQYSQQLPSLVKKHWLEEQFEHFRASKDFSPSVSNEAFTFIELTELCEKQDYAAAAHRCLEGDVLYDGFDEVVIPLHWAVANHHFELVFCLLALGVNVNETNDDGSECALTLACQLQDNAILNLLLIHPEIDIYVTGTQHSEYEDIQAFLGYSHLGSQIYPILRLLDPDYYSCHEFLNIDWDCYLGAEEEPLLYIGYQSKNIKLLRRLFDLVSDVNPYLSSWEGGRFINRVFYDAETSKNDSYPLKVLSWYGQHIGVLADESGDECNQFIDDILQASPRALQMLGMESMKERVESLDSKITLLEKKLSQRASDTQLIDGEAELVPQIKISLYNDIKRLGRVELDSQVVDFVYQRREGKHYFAAYLQNQPFPISIEIPSEHVFLLVAGELKADPHFFTEYQAYYHLLNMTCGFDVIAALFSRDGHRVIKRRDNLYHLSVKDFELIEGLLLSKELFVAPDIHINVQCLAELAERYTPGYVSPSFSTKQSTYNSLARSLVEAERSDEVTQFVIDYSAPCKTVTLSLNGKHIVSNTNDSYVLSVLVDEIKTSSFAAICQECGDYGLVDNMMDGAVHVECY